MSTEAGVAYGFVYDFQEVRDSSVERFKDVEELEAKLDELGSDFSVVNAGDDEWARVIITAEEHSASSEMGGGFFEFNSPHPQVIEELRELREKLDLDSPIKWYFYMYFQ